MSPRCCADVDARHVLLSLGILHWRQCSGDIHTSDVKAAPIRTLVMQLHVLMSASQQDAMEKQLQCMGRSLDLIMELASTIKTQRAVDGVVGTTKEAVSGAVAAEEESSGAKEVVGGSAEDEGNTCEEARTMGMTSMGGAMKFEVK